MKIGNLYALDQFKKFADSANQTGFQDSYAGTVLARNLTAVDPRVFEKKYPELAFVNSGIQVDNTGGYARRIQSLRLQDQGGFTTAGDASGNKGKISLAGEDSFLNVVIRESHSIWSDDEVQEAELQNINLVSNYVATHNRIYLREIDAIGYLGINGNAGLLNFSGFTADAAGDTVDELTSLEAYDAISQLITDQRNGVNNTPEYMANRVDMPVRVLNELSRKILDAGNGSMTVLTALQNNFPDVEFRGTARAEDVLLGGNTLSITVAYNNNEEAMKMRVPLALTIGEIIKTNSWDFRVDSKYRVAGLDILETTAGRYLTGL